MAQKLALQGLRGIKMAEVIKNTAAEYEVGEFFDVPAAQGMKRSANIDEKTIYADDDIYMSVKSDKGMKFEIELAELSLSLMGKLGAGVYDEDKGELATYSVPPGKEFLLSFASQQEPGRFRMFKMWCVELISIEENELKSKGDGVNIFPYKLVVKRKKRAMDDMPGVVKDGGSEDLGWLCKA